VYIYSVTTSPIYDIDVLKPGFNSPCTAYGIMNMMGVFAGYIVTLMLGSSTDAGNLGADFSKLSIVVLVAVILMLIFVKPKPELTYNQEN
jgi:MFS superfamily sulfate permease-like transporter